MKYANIVAAFYGSKWAIREDWHAILESIVRERASGAEPSAEEIQARVKSQDYRSTETVEAPKATAVVQLIGPVIPRATLMTEYSGGATHEAFARSVREAADDPNVVDIVLDVSSPGGTVEGIDMSVEAVRYANGLKPVKAVTEGLMCSAAYWIASQASEIIASPTATIGSIGVLAGHTDQTQLETNMGLKTTIFRSGPKKALGHPSETLSDTARDEIQREVDELYDVFLEDVASGRNRKKSEVKREWGDGAVYAARQALSLGLIDKIGSLHDVLSGTSSPSRSSARSRSKKGNTAMTPEELKQFQAEHPEAYAAIFAAGRAEGLQAGIEQGRNQATEARASDPADDPRVAALEKSLAKVTGELEQQRNAARAEKRLNIVATVIEQAQLPPFPVVEGFDLAASFRERVERDALSAETDEEAHALVTRAVAEQKATMPAADANAPRERRPARSLVPTGDTQRVVKPEGKKAEAEGRPVTNGVRQNLGLTR